MKFFAMIALSFCLLGCASTWPALVALSALLPSGGGGPAIKVGIGNHEININEKVGCDCAPKKSPPCGANCK